MIKYKVAGNTRTAALAAALAGSLLNDTVELTAIGAAAVNTCVKAVAVAEKMINSSQPQETQSQITAHAEFTEVIIDDADADGEDKATVRQAIKFSLSLAPVLAPAQ